MSSMAFRTLGNLTQQYYHDHIKKGNAFSTSQTHGQKNLSVQLSMPNFGTKIFQCPSIFLPNLYDISPLNFIPFDNGTITLVKKQIYTRQYQANDSIQDRLVKSTLKSFNDAMIVCVFDGHGGDKLSDYCANHVVQLIDNYVQEQKKQLKQFNTDKLIQQALKYTYKTLQQNFYQCVYKEQVLLNNRKIKNVGTCALTIIINHQKIYVGNCGDSQSIVVFLNAQNKIQFTALNDRLSVNNPIERERLKKQFPNDKDIVVQDSGGSYYLKGRLQPTSTLGDYYLKNPQLYKEKEQGTYNGPYIKSEPDIKIFPIQNNYKTIVVASDGVWDFLSKQTVAELSLKPNPHDQILDGTLKRVAQLHKATVQQIKQVDPKQKRNFHDDISIAVVSLKQN